MSDVGILLLKSNVSFFGLWLFGFVAFVRLSILNIPSSSITQ